MEVNDERIQTAVLAPLVKWLRLVSTVQAFQMMMDLKISVQSKCGLVEILFLRATNWTLTREAVESSSSNCLIFCCKLFRCIPNLRAAALMLLDSAVNACPMAARPEASSQESL